jgi:hypothetical protein
LLANLELYGTEDVPPIPKHIADERIALLKEHLSVLRSLPFMEQKPHIEYEVLKAMRHWKQLSNQEDVGL